MEHIWIPIAITSALCQTVRTAAQKDLNRHLSTLVTTYVRFLFGVPLLVAWTAGVWAWTGEGWPRIGPAFLIYTVGSSVGQFAGTALLLRLLTMRNFAVSSMLMKADLIFTALIGTVLFSEAITGIGWAAIALTFAGVVLISLARLPGGVATRGGTGNMLADRSIWLGLLVALMFALSYLLLREATLALQPASSLHRGAWAALASSGLQFVVMGLWLLWREPAGLRKIAAHLPASLVIGAVSGLGTISWFLASALQNAAYVAAVAQVQVVFTLLISWYWFRERIAPLELVGIGVIVAGVLMFRL
jgi:drug/metabolite transporter (DMT)-like permease